MPLSNSLPDAPNITPADRPDALREALDAPVPSGSRCRRISTSSRAA